MSNPTYKKHRQKIEDIRSHWASLTRGEPVAEKDVYELFASVDIIVGHYDALQKRLHSMEEAIHKASSALDAA